MACGHWLEELAGPWSHYQVGEGKYSRLDPCHLLSLHRSKAVSLLGGHELAGAGHQTHKSALMKT